MLGLKNLVCIFAASNTQSSQPHFKCLGAAPGGETAQAGTGGGLRLTTVARHVALATNFFYSFQQTAQSDTHA